MYFRCAAFLLLSLPALAAVQPQEEVFGATEELDDGLQGQVYEIPEQSSALPDFKALKPVGTIYTRRIDVSPRDWQAGFPGIANRFEWFAIEYKGTFTVEKPGEYTFRLVSDDGARLYIDDKLVIDNDGLHPVASKTGEVALDDSRHAITLQYFQGPRLHVALQLFYRFEGNEEATFPGQDIHLRPPNGFPRWPWGLAALVVAVFLATRFRQKAARVVIETPADLTLHICGDEITLRARSEPPGRESEIEWTVPLEQHQTVPTGRGARFTTSWKETGVKQVVARLGASADDVILYVFKTRNGGSTLADILDAEPPPIQRGPDGYKTYRKHDIPQDTSDPRVEP